MDEDEYKEWKGDERVGKCPYCKVPGWITDGGWCEHYIGTDDSCGGMDPYYPLVEEEPFDSFINVTDNLARLPARKQAAIIGALSRQSLPVVRAALNLVPEARRGFWRDLVRYRTLRVRVSESLFETTYFSYFAKSPEKTKAILTKKVEKALQELRANPDCQRICFLPDD